MIIIKNYPQIQLSKINTSTGTLFQTNLFSKSFLTNENNVLFVPNKTKLLMPNLNEIKHKNNGYLIEILFHGFNFSAKRYKLRRSKFYVDTHKSEVFICIDPISTDVKSRIHKRRLIFFSYDKDLLTQIEKTIKQFKLPDAYTGKGLFERNDTYIVKQRKKRK